MRRSTLQRWRPRSPASLAFYAAFAWLRCGQFPRFNDLFLFQKIFYQAGFYMWPMPLWEFWQPIVALFAFTIAWCLRQAVCERIPAPAPWLFFIAAYGLGTFSYYQGRSLLPNLPTTFLPAALLAFFWARQGLAALAGRSLAEIRGSADLRLIAIKTLPVTVFCLCGFLNLCRSLPASVLYATDTKGAVNARDMEPIWDGDQATRGRQGGGDSGRPGSLHAHEDWQLVGAPGGQPDRGVSQVTIE
jgi:hypothetical protein